MLVKLRFFYIAHPLRTVKKTFRSLRSEGAFSALSLALAGTLGVGNVFGVCLGIIIGGAGSVFWLLVSAVVSAVLKYSEVVLSHDNLLHTSEGSKGSMFITLGSTFSHTGRGMSIIYASSCLLLSLVMGSALQSGTARETMTEIFDTPPIVIAVFMSIAIAASILGGVKIIEKITAIAIPVTTIIYILITSAVIFINRANLPTAISAIFQSAFNSKSAFGGVVGFLFSPAVREGYSRGLLSNEAGCGTSTIAHARSGILNPASAGLMGIIEVFFDTALLCMLTAFAVLTSTPDPSLFDSGMALILTSVSSTLGFRFGILIFVCVLLFAYSTIVCWYYYGMECFTFLFSPGRRWLFLPIYLFFVAYGAFADNRMLVAITDGLMLILAFLTSLALIKNSDRIKHLSEKGGVISPRYIKGSVYAKAGKRR